MQDKEKLTDTLIKTIQGRDNFADVLMRLIQQIQKERENLAARSNQLEELAQTLQIQAKKVCFLGYELYLII
jgi:predicted CopG family antitoxin